MNIFPLLTDAQALEMPLPPERHHDILRFLQKQFQRSFCKKKDDEDSYKTNFDVLEVRLDTIDNIINQYMRQQPHNK
ncbi:hypothetical protein LSAT2_000909 [Lamellibrachia satsuma]|nr:hypothetical protein LSAT2_000909 [Lamellibrachia satsuma]